MKLVKDGGENIRPARKMQAYLPLRGRSKTQRNPRRIQLHHKQDPRWKKHEAGSQIPRQSRKSKPMWRVKLRSSLILSLGSQTETARALNYVPLRCAVVLKKVACLDNRYCVFRHGYHGGSVEHGTSKGNAGSEGSSLVFSSSCARAE